LVLVEIPQDVNHVLWSWTRRF